LPFAAGEDAGEGVDASSVGFGSESRDDDGVEDEDEVVDEDEVEVEGWSE
jgi:hypothetical protein